MSENVWFKHWAKKSLSSEDLNSLTDHEERVWWRFLSVASSQEPRWTVTYSVKLTEPALARSCASTPSKLRAALSRFQAMGMLTAIDGGWSVTNWERHQETPEAKRKREQRERDKQRDTERDMSQDSHTQEEQRTDLLSTKEVAPKRRTARKIEAEDVARWEVQWPSVDIPAMVRDYENWKGSDGHKDRVLGFENQLRDAWRREKFAKAQGRQIFKEEGIFAGSD